MHAQSVSMQSCIPDTPAISQEWSASRALHPIGRLMTAARRLVTYDIVEHSLPRSVGVVARHELEPMDARRVLLLDGRGWGSSNSLARATAETVTRTARMVVGPDAPPPGRSQQDMDALHWDESHIALDTQCVLLAVDAEAPRQWLHSARSGRRELKYDSRTSILSARRR